MPSSLENYKPALARWQMRPTLLSVLPMVPLANSVISPKANYCRPRADYKAVDLLGGDQKIAQHFQEGSFATIYLSPRDYHRVHMPLAGTLLKTIYVPGKLFSVNQTTASSVANLFARNERLVCLFETEAGPMALVLVGAMIVAGIDTVWSGQVCPGKDSSRAKVTDYSEHSPPIELATGAEMGRFRLGSTAIVLFGHGRVTLERSLTANSSVCMGQLLAGIKPA